MNQTTTDKTKLSELLTPGSEGEQDMLQVMADQLMQNAATARARGDREAAAKLLRAAANIMDDVGVDELDAPLRGRARTDGRRQTTPETEKIKTMLREGWREAHELQDATGMNANRVHSLLGRLKNSRDLKFEKRVITQYRLVP